MKLLSIFLLSFSSCHSMAEYVPLGRLLTVWVILLPVTFAMARVNGATLSPSLCSSEIIMVPFTSSMPLMLIVSVCVPVVSCACCVCSAAACCSAHAGEVVAKANVASAVHKAMESVLFISNSVVGWDASIIVCGMKDVRCRWSFGQVTKVIFCIFGVGKAHQPAYTV